MSNSLENIKTDYKLSPDNQKKIARELSERNRFQDSREFIDRAIQILLAWEENPQRAMQVMTEMDPTIDQYAFMQSMMDANALKQMYPDFPEQFGESWKEYLKNNPQANTSQVKSSSIGDAQNQQRARTHEGDYHALRDRLEETQKYIGQIDFDQISLEDKGFEKVEYDGWPLLHTHYSRFLPAKIGVLALADLMSTQKSPVISMNTFRVAGYDIAEECSVELNAFEKENMMKRTLKLSTGLPKPYDGEITASEALAEQRWKDKVFGKMRKSKETGKYSFEGEIMALGLIKVWRKNKEFQITLTELGKEFALSDNLVVSGEYKHEVGAFIEAEKEFIVKKIIPERKLELILCKAAIRIVQDQDVLKSKKMADYLDKIFKEKIEEFCEKKSLFSEKIRNDFLKKKSKIDPIEGLRAATMGRLSEIGIVSWEIDEHSQSVYKVRDDKLSEIIHQVK